MAAEVIKRDTLEGEKAEEAKKKIAAFYKKLEKEKVKASKATNGSEGEAGEPPKSGE